METDLLLNDKNEKEVLNPEYEKWVDWYCKHSPYMIFESDLIEEQVKGFTVVPNLKLRVKGLTLSEMLVDFVLVYHYFHLKYENYNTKYEDMSKEPSKKRKKNSIDLEILDQYSKSGYILIGAVPVITAYRKTDDEEENGILLYIDKISIQKYAPVDENYENRLLVVLGRSMLSDQSYTFDSNIIENVEGERKMVLENINSFPMYTHFEFIEIARILSSPFIIKKNVNSLSDHVAMKRKEMLDKFPQKGRKRTNLIMTKKQL